MLHFTAALRLHGIILFFIVFFLPVLVAQPTAYYEAGSSRKISQLTGDWDAPLGIPTRSRTQSLAELAATDLGSTFEHDGKLVFLFGDTWGGRDGFWDTLGISESTDPFQLEMTVPLAADNKWIPILPPGLDLDVFCVPSHGISVDGTIYVVYTQDGPDGTIMKRSFMTSTSNLGVTWQTLYQLENNTAADPRFVNVWLEERGGYIYMFGSGEYRASSPTLARIPTDLFPQKSAWRFYAGTYVSGQPVWSPSITDAAYLFSHNQLGEFSCCWIETLGCWVMLYNSGNPRGITMRTAAEPWGPWSGGKVIMHADDQAYGNFMHVSSDFVVRDLFSDPGRESEWGGEYGPYLIPRFTRGTAARCELYYTLSTWNPYQVILMRSIVGISSFPPPLPVNQQVLGHDVWHRYPAGVADSFERNGLPFLTTYTSDKGDENVGWLWQRMPAGTTEISFRLHGGHAEIFLLEDFTDLPAGGDAGVISQNLRNGVYGTVARRATGVNDNTNELEWTWDLRNLDPASVGVVVLDSATEPWGFLSFSDIHASVEVPPAAVKDWQLY